MLGGKIKSQCTLVKGYTEVELNQVHTLGEVTLRREFSPWVKLGVSSATGLSLYD